MKTTILVLSFLVFSLVASAQKTPPAIVLKAFGQKFQKAEKVKWDMEEAKEWEAEFTLSGKATSASFDLAGKWLESETEIKSSELPAAVKISIEKQYAGAKMRETALIETPDFNGYEITLKVKGKNVEIQATKDGKLKVNKE
ncbi:MAG TPA: PepSY-like domain-containing protein [Prolixibacteraceae bacterium]